MTEPTEPFDRRKEYSAVEIDLREKRVTIAARRLRRYKNADAETPGSVDEDDIDDAEDAYLLRCIELEIVRPAQLMEIPNP